MFLIVSAFCWAVEKRFSDAWAEDEREVPVRLAEALAMVVVVWQGCQWAAVDWLPRTRPRRSICRRAHVHRVNRLPVRAPPRLSSIRASSSEPDALN